jgi:hypothetical protein
VIPPNKILMMLGAVAALAILVGGYKIATRGGPFKVTEITHGTAGIFLIGEGKEAILARLPGDSFAAMDTTCHGWFVAGKLTPSQRSCLLDSNEWEAENDGTEATCNGRSANRFTTLHFTAGRLAKVVVRCVDPE